MGWLTGRDDDQKGPITAFWAWWPGVRERFAAELVDSGELSRRSSRAINQRVAAIHPEITWEFTDGTLARHAMILSGEGSADLRVLTERWRRTSPPADETWEYYPARPPNPGAMHGTITVGKRSLRPLQARFDTEVDLARGRVHVTIWHPDTPYLDEVERLWFAFLLLDWILGEDDVERWIGEVHFGEAAADLDGPGLRRVVTELSRELRGGGWAHLEGIDEAGRHLTVEVRIPSPRHNYPLFDTHGAIRIPLLTTPAIPDDEIAALAAPPSEPDAAELAEIAEFSDRLLEFLGDAVVLAAVETAIDSRTLHLYVDSTGVVADQVRTFLNANYERNPQRIITATWTHDPGWRQISHFS